MAFSESLKSKVRIRAHFTCCLCRKVVGVIDIHHIISQEDGGPDTEGNAAPLCPTCHRTFGDNPNSKKIIREARDSWFEICDKKFDDLGNTNLIISDYENIKTDLTNTKRRLQEVEEKIFHFTNGKNIKQSISQPNIFNKFINLLSAPLSLITEAKLYIQQKQYVEAEKTLKKVIEENPRSDEGYYLFGYLYGDEGEIDLMINAFDKSLAISDKFAKNITETKRYHWAKRFNAGVDYFNEASKVKDVGRAVELFSKATQAFCYAIICQPYEIDTYNNLAFTYINMGENEKAIEPIEKQIELYKNKLNLTEQSGPIEGDKYTNLADAYALQGEILTKLGGATEDKDIKNEYYNRAIEKMEEAKVYFPNDPSILLHLSNSYIATDKLNVAMELFKEGAEKEPENKYYKFNYGSMLLNAHDFENAAVQLKKAIEIDSEYENAIYNLAVTYVKWGATLREEAIKAEKEEDKTYLEKYKLALPHLEKYAKIDTKNAQFWDLLFKVYTNLNMNDKAMEALKRYEELEKENQSD